MYFLDKTTILIKGFLFRKRGYSPPEKSHFTKMRRHFSNVRSLFTNVRRLLSSVKCLLILFPGLGNSENSLPIQEKTLSMSHPTVHLTNSLHARIYARVYIEWSYPLFIPHFPHFLHLRQKSLGVRSVRSVGCFWLKTTTTPARVRVYYLGCLPM